MRWHVCATQVAEDQLASHPARGLNVNFLLLGGFAVALRFCVRNGDYVVLAVLLLVVNGVYGVFGGQGGGQIRHGEDVNLPSRAWHH